MVALKWMRVSRWNFIKWSLALGILATSSPLMQYLLLSAHPNSALIKTSSTITLADLPFEEDLRTVMSRQTPGEVTPTSSPMGRLNVHLWSGICNWDVDVLRNWPHFPFFPDKRSFIRDFNKTQDPEMKHYYGERIFGFIHPKWSGEYRFAITSDDTSELWLSPSEDPESSKMIARVRSPDNRPAWTLQGDYRRYPGQISKEISLHAGEKYYVETISKQECRGAHVFVYWSHSSATNSTFEIVSSEYLSSFSQDLNDPFIPQHAGKQATISPERKKNLYQLNHLPFIKREEYISALSSCPYSPSFLIKTKQKEYFGQSVTRDRVSYVYPPDDTNMFLKSKRSRPSVVIDKDRVHSVVGKFLDALQSSNRRQRGYYLHKIYKVVQKPDSEKGDRFLLDLVLSLNGTNETFRLTEHVYQKIGSNDLCLPEGITWNSSATIYFIIPVKDQGKWVHHFIKQVTEASSLTADTNFHVIIADFESKDIDMGKAFDTPLLRNRHTIIPLTGRFFKTFALNKAVESVPNHHDIVFLFDLHIDVPADLMDNVRKNTIAGRIAYFPIVGRLNCGTTAAAHKGFWEMAGYGILGIYKSDWKTFGGMDVQKYNYSWGGEDWDLLDRVLSTQLEAERIRHPGLYHHYHTKTAWHKGPKK